VCFHPGPTGTTAIGVETRTRESQVDSPTKTSSNLRLAGRCPSPRAELSDSRRDAEPVLTEPAVATLMEDECDDPVDSGPNVGDHELDSEPAPLHVLHGGKVLDWPWPNGFVGGLRGWNPGVPPDFQPVRGEVAPVLASEGRPVHNHGVARFPSLWPDVAAVPVGVTSHVYGSAFPPQLLGRQPLGLAR
jgi:hypothetical protein